MYLWIWSFLHNIVTPLASGDGFILDGLGGTTADAGHTVSTVPLPYRLPVHQVDVV